MDISCGNLENFIVFVLWVQHEHSYFNPCVQVHIPSITPDCLMLICYKSGAQNYSSDSQGPEGKLRYEGNGLKSRRVKVPFANDLGGGMKKRGYPQ